MPSDGWRPDWDAPDVVRAWMSTRQGGASASPFDSLNLHPPGLGGPDADTPQAVQQNQRRFADALGLQPVWLQQVHGFEHLDDALGRAAVEVVDVQHDAIDRKSVV